MGTAPRVDAAPLLALRRRVARPVLGRGIARIVLESVRGAVRLVHIRCRKGITHVNTYFTIWKRLTENKKVPYYDFMNGPVIECPLTTVWQLTSPLPTAVRLLLIRFMGCENNH